MIAALRHTFAAYIRPDRSSPRRYHKHNGAKKNIASNSPIAEMVVGHFCCHKRCFKLFCQDFFHYTLISSYIFSVLRSYQDDKGCNLNPARKKLTSDEFYDMVRRLSKPKKHKQQNETPVNANKGLCYVLHISFYYVRMFVFICLERI